MYLQHDPLQDQGYQGTSPVKRRGQYTGKEDADDSGKGADMTGGIIIFSFTRTGTELSRQLRMRLSQENKRCCGYAPEKFAGEGIEPVSGEIRQIIGKNWGKNAFIFIGAAGIAVRYIAPFVKDKFTDSAVLVLDEKGEYVIPLLSGHMGGAVRMADGIAGMIGAEAVHTTATDVQKKFAVDVFAGENHLYITDRRMAKEISAAVLEGERVAFFPEYQGCRIEGNIPEELILCRDYDSLKAFRHRIIITDNMQVADGRENNGTLVLKPRNITAGIGCRRGIGRELLKKGLESILAERGLSMEQVERIASIDLKKDEPGILQLADEYGIPFITYPAEELKKIGNVTSSSSFVEQVTGVDNVCERAALMCCGEGKLIQGKSVRDSMTAALARSPLILRMDV